MNIPTDFSTYGQWSGYLTLVFLILTIIAFVLSWNFRFRLVGVTGFMGVLTFGLFTLGLGLTKHTAIPGSIHYTLVYDNAANQTVIAVPPQVTKSEVEATLRQAAYDLYSPGRNGLGQDKLTVRLRTVIHPESGISKPVYLGKIERSLSTREDENMEVEVFSKNFAQLPKNKVSKS